jgi:hypothetical protein
MRYDTNIAPPPATAALCPEFRQSLATRAGHTLAGGNSGIGVWRIFGIEGALALNCCRRRDACAASRMEH